MSATHAALLMHSGFLPTQISGLDGWFDASATSTVSTSGAAVTAWSNRTSGPATSVSQATSGNRPTYAAAAQNGLNGILYDGTDDFLRSANAIAQFGNVSGWSIIAALKPTQNTVAQNAMQVDAVDGVSARASLVTDVITGFWRTGGRRNNADAFASATSSTQASTSSAVVMATIANYTGTTCTLYLNGSQIAVNASWLTSGSTPNDNGTLTLGNSGAGTAPWKGYLFEVCLFNRALSTTEMAVVVSYLRAKWGI